MIKIRRKVFESNSSMTHVLSLCSDEEWNRWKDGDLLFDTWGEEFVPTKDAPEEDIVRGEYDDDYERHYYSFNNFFDGRLNEYNEMYSQEYTTENGELIHAFGYFGHD